MPRPLRATLSLPTLLAALLLSAPAVPAALSADTRAGAAAGVTLEICRLPGSLDEYSGEVIRIPAGTTFSDDVFDPEDSTESSGGGPVSVATTAPVSLGASAFCVRVPVRPLTPADGTELQSSFGRMFVANGKGARVAVGRVFNRVYGLLRNDGG